MNSEKRGVSVVAAVLAAIFLIAAVLCLLKFWETGRGRYREPLREDDTVLYKGDEYVLKDSVETFLVLGLDKLQGAESAQSHESGVQTDFLMLFVFDNDTREFSAVQINRDTVTNVNRLLVGGTSVGDTYSKQIALAYNYANTDNEKIKCRNTKDSVEYLLNGMKVNHYMSVTMDSIAVMNDLVGGVNLTVLDDFTGVDNTLVKGREVTLNGAQALNYVRTRYGLEDSSNITRMERQRQYIGALYEKTVSCMKEDDDFILEWIDKLNDYIVYDSSNSKMQKYIEKFEEYDFSGVKSIEGEAKEEEGLMAFYPDEESVREIVMELFYNKQ